MKKSIIIVILLLLIILGISYLGKNKSEIQNPQGNETTEMAKYFEAQIIALGVKDIGQPIEGFDVDLVRLAFPGFITTDFEGVETFEGYYTVNEGRVEYIRSADEAVTTEAGRTISSKGYATLLKNTSARLSISATSKETIDSLIQAVNLAEKVSARIGETVSALGTIITPVEIIEDSRCPKDVNCFQAGTVRLKTNLGSGLGGAEQIFILNEPITTEAEIVTLISVEPSPKPQIKIEAKDYIFLFEIQKLPQEIIETSGGL